MAVRGWPLFMRRVVGESMIPSLWPGQLLLVSKRFHLQEGAIFVIRHEGREKIKRLGKIDGQRIFVVGDNAVHSTDSRHFGWLSADSVIGRVVWPRLTIQK